ncbi:hypothetical protein ACFQ45_08945 [Rhodanobacter aciditrophus]|uniref:Phosphodiesterase n=1 Tax=Rhodanobacter aciditrophus TaxID=1623218 RepID=A0ABW4B1W5_9GAMM
MNIISHRGYWKNEKEKNTELAFRNSFELGFGTETDIRDLDGEIVISHDIPKYSDELMLFSDFLSLYKSIDDSLPLALNVKSDGLQIPVKALLEKKNVKNYFLFDMSIPDMIQTKNYGLRFLTRVSDVEKEAIMLDASSGVWMDEFYEEWIDKQSIDFYTEQGMNVYLVSPELHKRRPEVKWSLLKSSGIQENNKVCLCTDLPEVAAEFFRG